MTECLVKASPWLRAYGSVTIDAADDVTALETAKSAAKTLMESRAYPEAIDTDERGRGSSPIGSVALTALSSPRTSLSMTTASTLLFDIGNASSSPRRAARGRRSRRWPHRPSI